VFAELINTLLILGAGQGVFLALILATRHANSIANRLLAVAMLAFSIFLLQGVYYARGSYEAFPHFIGVTTPLIFVFGPICYLYAKAISEGDEALGRTDWLHFLPAIGVTLWFLPFFLENGASKLTYLHALFEHGPPRDLAIIEALQYPQGIAYVVLTIRLLRRHRARLKESYSSTEGIDLLWLRDLTLGVAAVWTVATGLFLLEILGVQVAMNGSLTPLAVAVMVYGVGYMGLRQPEILHRTPAPTASTGAAPEEAEYAKSGLTPVQAEASMQQLRRVMEEKRLFLRGQLTLPELAEATGLSLHNLSEVINTRAGENFYDFVNRYRVEEVKRRLLDPRSAHLTILALAEESGFNSKSVFNACFKERTGLTPSRYRAERV